MLNFITSEAKNGLVLAFLLYAAIYETSHHTTFSIPLPFLLFYIAEKSALHLQNNFFMVIYVVIKYMKLLTWT
jgi:hypothetical protein